MLNKKTASLPVSLLLIAALGTVQDALAESVDDLAYAVKVGDAILAACPKTEAEARDHEKIIECIAQTRDSAYGLAADLSTYIKEQKKGFGAGMAQGDLLRYCEWPVRNNEKAAFKGLRDRFNKTMQVATECLHSVRRASDAVGLSKVFQTTAWNTVANQINCMTGKPSCVRPTQKGTVELVPTSEI